MGQNTSYSKTNDDNESTANTYDYTTDEEPHSFKSIDGFHTATTHDLPGHKITKVLGTVYGIAIEDRMYVSRLIVKAPMLAQLVRFLEALPRSISSI